MAKFRGFSIVLHDVQKGKISKNDVQGFIKSAKSPAREYVLAEEPYPHQEGSHIHVFVRYQAPRAFKPVLSEWCNLWSSGRVQVDIMHGSMAQGCQYVSEAKSQKDKFFDPHPIIVLDLKAANAAGVVTQKERPQSDGSMGIRALHELIKELRMISPPCLEAGPGRPRDLWI